jgi:hypothetical protein
VIVVVIAASSGLAATQAAELAGPGQIRGAASSDHGPCRPLPGLTLMAPTAFIPLPAMVGRGPDARVLAGQGAGVRVAVV